MHRRFIIACSVLGIAALSSLSLVSAASDASPIAMSSIDPAHFVDSITNPNFPLTPGTTFIYEGQSENIPPATK